MCNLDSIHGALAEIESRAGRLDFDGSDGMSTGGLSMVFPAFTRHVMT